MVKFHSLGCHFETQLEAVTEGILFRHCARRQCSKDLCWHQLISADNAWPWLTRADHNRPQLTNKLDFGWPVTTPDLSRQSLTSTDNVWPLLTMLGLSWPRLTSPDHAWPRLTNDHACPHLTMPDLTSLHLISADYIHLTSADYIWALLNNSWALLTTIDFSWPRLTLDGWLRLTTSNFGWSGMTLPDLPWPEVSMTILALLKLTEWRPQIST